MARGRRRGAPTMRNCSVLLTLAVVIAILLAPTRADESTVMSNLQHHQVVTEEEEEVPLGNVESHSSPNEILEEEETPQRDLEDGPETSVQAEARAAKVVNEEKPAKETKETKPAVVEHARKEESSNNASAGEEATTQGGKQRLWGSPNAAATHASSSSSTTGVNKESEKVADASSSSFKSSDEENATRVQLGAASNIPFVPGPKPGGSSSSTAHSNHHAPPTGFTISARVYIDPKDSLAHFDDNPARITLPYWDCGVTGATTSPLPLKNAYFRHALASTSTSWTGTDGKHPVLAVALTPLVLELNSGESQTLQAGQVFLLEDVLLSGHRMNPLKGGGDLKVLFLTLPQQHYHTGKQHLSLKLASKKDNIQDPCPDIKTNTEDANHQASFQDASLPLSEPLVVVNSSLGRRIRLAVLAAIGMSLSTLAADFLGKTAPLWLAVGIGGTCFVAGSTYALTVLGDRLVTALELWHEQRRLHQPRRRSQRTSPDAESIVETTTASSSSTRTDSPPIPPLQKPIPDEVHAM